jgi:hypothetical protein
MAENGEYYDDKPMPSRVVFMEEIHILGENDIDTCSEAAESCSDTDSMEGLDGSTKPLRSMRLGQAVTNEVTRNPIVW